MVMRKIGLGSLVKDVANAPLVDFFSPCFVCVCVCVLSQALFGYCLSLSIFLLFSFFFTNNIYIYISIGHIYTALFFSFFYINFQRVAVLRNIITHSSVILQKEIHIYTYIYVYTRFKAFFFFKKKTKTIVEDDILRVFFSFTS